MSGSGHTATRRVRARRRTPVPPPRRRLGPARARRARSSRSSAANPEFLRVDRARARPGLRHAARVRSTACSRSRSPSATCGGWRWSRSAASPPGATGWRRSSRSGASPRGCVAAFPRVRRRRRRACGRRSARCSPATSPGTYPTVRLAVLAAVVFVASPFLTRPVRRLGQLTLLVVVPGTMILGLGGVDAVVGALGIGWGIAPILHLGARVAGRSADDGPGRGRARRARRRHHLGRAHARPADRVDPRRRRTSRRSARCACASTAATPPTPGSSPRRGASSPTRTPGRRSRSPVCSRWSTRRCACSRHTTPACTCPRSSPPASPVLRRRCSRSTSPSTRRSPRSTKAQPSTPASPSLWDDVRRFRDARVAHGALDGEHVLVGDVASRPSSTSTAGRSRRRRRASISTSPRRWSRPRCARAPTRRSMPRARAFARRRAARCPALPHPPGAQPGVRAAALRAQKGLLDELATALVARTDGELVRPVELRRVKPLNIVMFVALLVARVGDPRPGREPRRAHGRRSKTADWPWLVVGFLLAQSTAIAFACNTLGSVPQAIPLVPAVLLQMAVSFVNLVAPTGASAAIMNIRFLQKQGVEVGPATSSGVLLGVAGTRHPVHAVRAHRDRRRPGGEPLAGGRHRSRPRGTQPDPAARPGRCGGQVAFPTRGPSRFFGGDDALVARAHAIVMEALGGGARPWGSPTGSSPPPSPPRSPGPPRWCPPGDSAAFLAPLPAATLDRPELVDVLGRLGLRTLGALAALPERDVLARFGLRGPGGLAAGRRPRRAPAGPGPAAGRPHRQRGARPAGGHRRPRRLPRPRPGRGAARPAVGQGLGVHPGGDRRRDRARRAPRAGVARRGRPHRRRHRRPAPLAARRLAAGVGPPSPHCWHQPAVAHARRGRARRRSPARLLGQRRRHRRPGQPRRRPRAGPARLGLGGGARVAGQPRPGHPDRARGGGGRRPHRRATRRPPRPRASARGPGGCRRRRPPGSTASRPRPTWSTRRGERCWSAAAGRCRRRRSGCRWRAAHGRTSWPGLALGRSRSAGGTRPAAAAEPASSS